MAIRARCGHQFDGQETCGTCAGIVAATMKAWDLDRKEVRPAREQPPRGGPSLWSSRARPRAYYLRIIAVFIIGLVGGLFIAMVLS